MKYMSVSELRKKLSGKFLDALTEPIVITQHGKPAAILVSIHEFNSLMVLIQDSDHVQEKA